MRNGVNLVDPYKSLLMQFCGAFVRVRNARWDPLFAEPISFAPSKSIASGTTKTNARPKTMILRSIYNYLQLFFTLNRTHDFFLTVVFISGNDVEW